MKPKLLFAAICFCFINVACRKNDSAKFIAHYQNPVKQKAVDYIKTQLSSEDLDKLDLSSIQSFKMNDTLTMLEVFMRDTSATQRIFLNYDQKDFTGNWVDFNYKGSFQNGVIRTWSFDDQVTHEVSFINGKVKKLIVQDHGHTRITVVRHPKTNIPGSDKVVTTQVSQAVEVTEIPDDGGGTLPPVTVVGYINNTANVLHQLYAMYYLNYTPSVMYSYSTTPPSSGISPAGGVTINGFSGPNVIGNIGDYNNCFDNVPGADHKYTITICVDQPSAASRSAWGYSQAGSSGSASGGNPVDVGHTFLILKEVAPQKTITRNVGFYPVGNVSPLDPTDAGQLNNNEAHYYDVALTVTVTSSQFTNAINYINNFSALYDLNDNNCTSFALGAMAAAGINISTTSGSWPGGGGKDPGDLGEDIRTMTLSSNMARSSKYTAHPNVGSCH